MPFASDPRRSNDKVADACIRYCGAVVIVLAAAAVRWLLQPVMGAAPPYITYYLAVVAAAAFGGLGPGVVATLFGAVLGVAMARWPSHTSALSTSSEQVRLLLYVLSGFAITLIAGRMHQANHQVHAEADRLRQLTDELGSANERLRESDRSKDQFLAVLAHELRNPLMPIKNSLALLRLRGGDPAVADRAQAVMGRQVDQLTRLVNDLLDVTRIRHGKLDLQRSRIDLRDVVMRTVDDHRMLFLERRVGLHQRRPPQPVWVHGDPARLAQVIGNLLNNALKFTPSEGDVHVDLAVSGAHAVLQVSDSGVGIPRELLGAIFEPFTQAEQPIERPAGGLGLGLALVRNLVQMHGGEVDAHSDGAGRGAVFRLRLPIESHEAPVSEPAGLPAGASVPWAAGAQVALHPTPARE